MSREANGTRDSGLGIRGSGLGTRWRLVVGLGATGLSVARHLAAAGKPFAVTDSRPAPPKMDELAAMDDVPSCFGAFSSPLPLEQITEAVVSPGVSLEEPFLRELRDAGVPIIGDIELFARALRAPGPESRIPVIAITGSNGKSTVTAWTAEIAAAAGKRVAVGGNFGTPALDLLADDVELYVLELSSFQLELTERLPCRAATVLNISADHIDRHGSLDRYAAIKSRIFAACDVALLNADDALVVAMDTGAAEIVRFGASPTADYRLLETDDGLTLARGDTPWLAATRLNLAGRHNVANAAAVWALLETMHIDESTIRAGLADFAGLPHRCQTVAVIDGVRWVNDSKGTNPGALLASLAGMDAPVVLLAGGQGKGADFAALGPVAGARARAVLVFGEDGPVIAAAVAGHAPVERFDTMIDAVARAAELAERGDVVLLSPGCASFDQFENYIARGEAFTAAVQELAA